MWNNLSVRKMLSFDLSKGYLGIRPYGLIYVLDIIKMS